MVYPTTIKLFLVNGQPDGLRTAEISNWSGLAVACPRSDFAALKTREELASPGVYFLVGIDDVSGLPQIYIGEAEDVLKRVASTDHAAKEFWTKVICFISKDASLSKGHIKYLEGRILEKANALGINTLNSQKSGAVLAESDMADMEQYLDRLFQLLPVCGLTVFEAPESLTADSDKWLFCTIKGLTAKGRRTNNGFLVTAGSEAVLKTREGSSAGIKAMRQKHIGESTLVEDDGRYVFEKDIEFSSPSYAAAMVCGGNTNGLTSWRDKLGNTLKQLDEL